MSNNAVLFADQQQKSSAGITTSSNNDLITQQILLVDDNLINQKLGLVLIKWLGYAAKIAGTGQEAIDAVAKNKYELILMDCQMPEMDGFEATRRIRKAEIGTGRHIPIVALTASELQQDQKACVAAGMDGYLAKPVDMDQLGDMIKQWMTK